MGETQGEEKNSSEEHRIGVQPYDPTMLAKELKKIVCQGSQRKYYRLARAGHWYGGIATADCCGCNLRCVFCWSGKPRNHPETMGTFYQPLEVAGALIDCARKRRYQLVRISGNEPTLGREHLIQVMHSVERSGLAFILETNGILLDLSLAKALSSFSNLHVRVSLKGTDSKQFYLLTGARPESFSLQLSALENLLVAGVSCHPAVMASFSSPDNLEHLRATLRMISSDLVRNLEEEIVIIYPHVARKLKQAGLQPRKSYRP